MNDETIILVNHQGQPVRLTQERHDHILQHPEMVGQMEKIRETVAQPDSIVATKADVNVHVYHRSFTGTPVTDKFLLVAVNVMVDDAFVLTAFFSSRQKKGTKIWPV